MSMMLGWVGTASSDGRLRVPERMGALHSQEDIPEEGPELGFGRC